MLKYYARNKVNLSACLAKISAAKHAHNVVNTVKAALSNPSLMLSGSSVAVLNYPGEYFRYSEKYLLYEKLQK